MIYKLTQIHDQMQAEIYPDLSGRWRHNSILNRWVNMYIIAKIFDSFLATFVETQKRGS